MKRRSMAAYSQLGRHRNCTSIDQIGYLDNAVAAARKMAGVDYANVVFYHRKDDPALSPYSITPNTPLQKGLIPVNVPGLDRSKLA